jgi:hypothetical protein
MQEVKAKKEGKEQIKNYPPHIISQGLSVKTMVLTDNGGEP